MKCFWFSECGGLVVDMNDTVDLWNPYFLDEATEVQRTKVRCSRSLHKGKESGFVHSFSQFHSPCSLHCVLLVCGLCLACVPGPKGVKGSRFWCSAALSNMEDQVWKENFLYGTAMPPSTGYTWNDPTEIWSLPHNGFLRRAAGLSSPLVTFEFYFGCQEAVSKLPIHDASLKTITTKISTYQKF